MLRNFGFPAVISLALLGTGCGSSDGSPLTGDGSAPPSNTLICGIACSGSWSCGNGSLAAQPQSDACALSGEDGTMLLACNGTASLSPCTEQGGCTAEVTWEGAGTAVSVTTRDAGLSVTVTCTQGGAAAKPDAGSASKASCWQLGPTQAACSPPVGMPAPADWCAPQSTGIYCNDGRSYLFECQGDATGCYCHCLTGGSEALRCEYAPVTCGSPQKNCLAVSACGFPSLETQPPPKCMLDSDCPASIPHCNQVSTTCEPMPAAPPAAAGCWLDGYALDSVPSFACSFQTKRAGCDDGNLYELGCSGSGPTCTCTCKRNGDATATCTYTDGSTSCMKSLSDCGFPASVANAQAVDPCASAAVCPSSLPYCNSGRCASRTGS